MSDTPIPAAHVRDVCRIGQGAACCSYMMAGPDGMVCAKGTPLQALLDQRRAEGRLVSLGDNCDGWPQ